MATGVKNTSSEKRGNHPVIRSATVMRETLRLPSIFNALTKDAGKLVTTAKDTREQTDRDAPVVVCNDLTKGAGTEVEVTLLHEIDGHVIMGNDYAAGKGVERTKDHDTVKIDRSTKPVKDGDIWDIQERGFKLRDFNKSDLGTYFRKHEDQKLMYHLSGARGHMNSIDSKIPLAEHELFDRIMTNPLQAPSAYSGGDGSDTRHFFPNGRDSISGTAGKLTATDTMSIDEIRRDKRRLEEMAHPPEPILLSKGDDMYQENPLYVKLVSPRLWEVFAADSDTKEFNQMRANALERSKIFAGGNKYVHPLFLGDCILVDNILVKKVPYFVRFLPGQNITVDDATKKGYSPVTQKIAANAQFAVDRAVIVGGQAIMAAYGNTMAGAKRPSGTDMTARNFDFLEESEDFGRKSESAIEWVNGMKKTSFFNKEGVRVDRGVISKDYAVPLKY